MPKPEVRLAVLCDDVRHEVGGKVSLMGLFDRFTVPDFTQPLPPFRVFVKVAFHEEGQHRLAINIRSQEGDFRVGMQGVVLSKDLEESSGRYVATMNVGFNSLKIPREGMYQIEIVCDDEENYSIPFKVVTVRPPTL